jgi:hypothetical protein
MQCELKGWLQFAGRSSKIQDLRAFIEFSAVFFLAASSFAQVDRSGLTSAVTDPSCRLLVETHITAVQNSTELRRETVSNSVGSYDLPELPVGAYTVTFEHPGFRTVTFVDVEQVLARDSGPHDAPAGGTGKQTLIYLRQAP